MNEIARRHEYVNRPMAVGSATAALACLLWVGLAAPGIAQESVLRCDPAHTVANITLGDTLHTVHGSFQAKRGEIQFDPASGKAGGEIVFDAASGQTGNNARDRKMHKDVLESQRYPEISFRPDHTDGSVSFQGPSTLQVHGVFGIHGADHEITVPVTLKWAQDHWEATAHFQLPYVQWGMKNPSMLLLRVGPTVDVGLHAEGSLVSSAR